MGQPNRSRTALHAAALVIALASMGSLAACRVGDSDVKRWETTEHGPYKLVAVVTHDKYAWDLRTQAAMSLVRMPPRAGQRLGTAFLVEEYQDDDGVTREGALNELSEDARRQIVDGMAPELIAQMQGPPPPVDEKTGRAPPDPTIPYKDAAFALLSHEPTLVSNEQTRQALTAALISWAQTGFEQRIDGAQQFGVEQMVRFLGATSVKQLPSLINENSTKLDRITALISDIADDDTKLRASQALVALATRYASAAWNADEVALVKKHNQETNQKADDGQVAVQVGKVLDRHLNEETFPAMKKIGGRPVVDYLLTFAADKTQSDERRQTALGALEGRLDKNNAQDLDRVFAVAKDDATSDAIRDVAFKRVAEFPKEMTVPRLYTVFDGKKWKVRWVAASLVLSTITPKGIVEFMRHLPSSAAVKQGMTEGLSYGGIIAKMDTPAGEPKPRDAIMPYLGSHDFGPRMTALGFFWEGKKADVPVVQVYADDKQPLPKCDKDDDCQWQCSVPKAPGSKDTDQKDLATIGDLVRFCLIPSMDK